VRRPRARHFCKRLPIRLAQTLDVIAGSTSAYVDAGNEPMPRLTLDETSISGQYARSAHIAAMGQRLAAAGPRTRQRVTRRYHPLAEAGEDVAAPAMPEASWRAPALVADRSHAFIRDIAPILPPSPRRRMFTAIGRTAALCVMASAGFALVLAAQSPRWSAGQHLVAKKQIAAVAPKPEPEQPAKALQPATPSQLAENLSGKAAPSAPPVQQAPPATVPAATTRTAPPAATPLSVPPASPAPRPMQVQLAVAHRPRPEAQKPVHLVAHHEAPHPATLVHYALPRWLTEDRPIIMSPPPHNLEAPVAQQAATMQAEKPHPALPPLPRPRLIYASAGYARPPPNPAYYGAAYPYGYYQPQPNPP
jgi:hypothetical protein